LNIWEETFEFDKDAFPAPQPIPVNETASEATADETQRKRGKKRKINSGKNIEKPMSKKTDKVSFFPYLHYFNVDRCYNLSLMLGCTVVDRLIILQGYLVLVTNQSLICVRR
jgi:hypothetical protein